MKFSITGPVDTGGGYVFCVKFRIQPPGRPIGRKFLCGTTRIGVINTMKVRKDWQESVISQSQGVGREAEFEGSRRQTHGSRETNGFGAEPMTACSAAPSRVNGYEMVSRQGSRMSCHDTM